jgi:hypothetical protein
METTQAKPAETADLAQSITTAWGDWLTRERNPSTKRHNVYASAWRPCTRRMVLEMVEGDKLPAWDANALANFRRGQDRERDLVNDLRAIGRNAPIPFEVHHTQERFEISDRKGRVCLTGRKDGDLVFSNGQTTPFEVKAWSQNTVARINCFNDLQRSPWTKAASFQLLAYLFGFNRPLGFFILDRHGLPLPVAVELDNHYEEMEEFLQRAEQAMDAREAYLAASTPEAAEAALPPFIDDAAECKRCPFFGAVCNPPIFHDAAKVLADPELEAFLERREELQAAADEYEDIDQAVKATLRGIETGICGRFLITGKWGPHTTYPLPKEVKAQYRKVDEKGKFTLHIEKVSA